MAIVASQFTASPLLTAASLAQKVVSVSTTQVELFTGVSRSSRRLVLRVYNDSADTVYIGPTGVSSSGSTKGEPIADGESLTITIGDFATYAITASGTASLIVTELLK